MTHDVKYHFEINENGIIFNISLKPNSRLSEANILTILRNTIAKISDME